MEFLCGLDTQPARNKERRAPRECISSDSGIGTEAVTIGFRAQVVSQWLDWLESAHPDL